MLLFQVDVFRMRFGRQIPRSWFFFIRNTLKGVVLYLIKYVMGSEE